MVLVARTIRLWAGVKFRWRVIEGCAISHTNLAKGSRHDLIRNRSRRHGLAFQLRHRNVWRARLWSYKIRALLRRNGNPFLNWEAITSSGPWHTPMTKSKGSNWRTSSSLAVSESVAFQLRTSEALLILPWWAMIITRPCPSVSYWPPIFSSRSWEDMNKVLGSTNTLPSLFAQRRRITTIFGRCHGTWRLDITCLKECSKMLVLESVWLKTDLSTPVWELTIINSIKPLASTFSASIDRDIKFLRSSTWQFHIWEHTISPPPQARLLHRGYQRDLFFPMNGRSALTTTDMAVDCFRWGARWLNSSAIFLILQSMGLSRVNDYPRDQSKESLDRHSCDWRASHRRLLAIKWNDPRRIFVDEFTRWRRTTPEVVCFHITASFYTRDVTIRALHYSSVMTVRLVYFGVRWAGKQPPRFAWSHTEAGRTSTTGFARRAWSVGADKWKWPMVSYFSLLLNKLILCCTNIFTQVSWLKAHAITYVFFNGHRLTYWVCSQWQYNCFSL